MAGPKYWRWMNVSFFFPIAVLATTAAICWENPSSCITNIWKLFTRLFIQSNLNTPKMGEPKERSEELLSLWNMSARRVPAHSYSWFTSQHQNHSQDCSISSRRSTCVQRPHAQNMTLKRPVWDFNMPLTRMWPLDAPMTRGTVHAINPYK